MATNRQFICATICLLVGIAAESAVGDEGDKAAKSNKTSLILERSLEVDPKADEVTRLLIERRNATVEFLHATYALFVGGKGSLDPVALAAERALAAQIEVPGSNKIHILEQHVTFARDLNKIVDERFNQGVADATSHALAKCLRLDMELRLAREKLAAKKPA